MSETARGRADSVERAWRAFAAEDLAVQAPPALEGRVVEAMRNAHLARRAVSTRRRRGAVVGLAVAAGLVLAIAGAVTSFLLRSSPPPPISNARVPASSPSPGLPAPAEPRVSATGEPPQIAAAAGGESRTDSLPGPLVTFAADPMLASEPLQLVRVRVPRGVLPSLGVALLDPEAGGTVEMDVLVGGDGLPRDIRRIQLISE